MRTLRHITTLACAVALTGAGLSAQFSLQTLYAANNGGSPGGIVYFDIAVANPVLITAFDTNYDPGYAPTGTPVGVDVYTTPGTYVGVEGAAGAWTQVASGSGTAAGVLNTPTNLPLTAPLLMPAGNYGMALVATGGAGHDYTTGGTGMATYSDPFLTLTLGAGYNTPFGSSSPFSPRWWNGGIYYNPADGLYANFSATPTSGPTPLAVQFTDTTFTSDPGGVTSFAWDLDGDGVVDSTVQNPPFTYNTCGYYDVTLTVTDTMHSPSTLTKTGFIVADPQLVVNADFTAAPQGGGPPLLVQFTDTSTGSPTAWSWDLDGDGVADSTLQNPTFTYNTGGFFDVTLTASNACGADTETKVGFISVIANDECSGAIPVTVGLNGPFTNSGSTNSLPAWPCAGGGGSDVWFSYTATCPITVTFDTCTGSSYDTAIEIFDGSCGALNSILCNDDSCGLQSSVTVTAVVGTTYYIRVGGYAGSQGNFSLNVTTSGSGSFNTITTGCGANTIAASGSPNLSGTVTYDLGSITGVPFMWVGVVQLNTPLCPPATCTVGTTFDFTFPAASISAPIPCDPSLVGGIFYTQGADIGATGGCPAGMPFVLTVTDTIATTIG